MLAAHEMVNLGRQIGDVATMASLGASPLTILATQGEQIASVFMTSQASLGGFARQIGSMLSPARIAAGAIAAVGVAAAASVTQYMESQRELEASLMGLGRGSGQTVGSLNRVADAVAAVGTVSRSTAREVAAIYAAAGRIDASLVPSLTQASRGFGLLTDRSPAEAARALAQAMRDPVRGVDMLDDALGGVNDQLRQFVRASIESGNRLAAQKALVDAMTPSLSRAEERVGALTRSWEAFIRTTGNELDALGRKINEALGTGGLEQRYADMVRRSQQGPQWFGGGAARAQADNLGEQLRRQNQLASAQAREQAAALESMRIGDLVRGIVSDLSELTRLTEQRDSLRAAAQNQSILAQLDAATRERFGQALQQAEARVENFATATDRLREQNELAVRGIEAYTLAERASVEAERARLEVIRNSGDTVRAAVAAEGARNQAIAEANRRAMDMLRDARDAASLIGLSPYARGRQQLLNEFRRENLTIGTGAGAGYSSPPLAAANQNIRNIEGLTDDFAGRLRALIEAIPGVSITSGLRSYAEQARLYAEKGPGWAAPPGRSRHESGLAADLAFATPEARAEAHRRAAEFGIGFPLGHEPWHAEPIGGRGGVSGDLAESQRLRLQTYDLEQIQGPMREYTQQLEQQIAANASLRSSLGGTYEEMTRASEAQRMLNEFSRNGVTLSESQRAAVMGLAQGFAAAAAEARRLAFEQQQIGELQTLAGDVVKGGIMDFVNALRNGANAWEAFRTAAINALSKIGEKLISMAIDKLMFNAFNGGSGGGGIFGSLFGAPAAVASPFAGMYAHGGVFDAGRVIPFAGGGIVTGATMFPLRGGTVGVMGERGPEAVMPLTRTPSGRLGVAAAGARTAPAISYSSQVIVQGNATPDTVALIRGEMAKQEAKFAATLKEYDRGLLGNLAEKQRRAG